MTYKTILVHLDSGKRCPAVQLGIRLAKSFDAHLVGLHALTVVRLPGYAAVEAGPGRRGAAAPGGRVRRRGGEEVQAGGGPGWRVRRGVALVLRRRARRGSLDARYAAASCADRVNLMPQDGSSVYLGLSHRLVLCGAGARCW